MLFLSIAITVHAKEIPYNHNSITINEVKELVDYPVLAPDAIPFDWTLEIKTYPMDSDKDITHFRLHYMDQDDTVLMVGIEQKKEPTTDWYSPYAEVVDINGGNGVFEAWGNVGEVDEHGEMLDGGTLYWKQNGTYVLMNSGRISKERMIEIARSMRVVE